MTSSQRRKPKYVFTLDELSLMIAIVGDRNPDNFSSPTAKALIYKCKAAVKDEDIIFKVAK
jgi:hypothetical protein